MLQELEQLLVIQNRDQRVSDLNDELARLPKEKEGAALRLTSEQTTVADIESTIMENEIAMKNLELDVDTRKDSIAKLKVQQYETRKNAEFTAMEHEIDRYSQEISKLEDAQLELMEKGETLSSQLNEARESLAKSQETVDAELAILTERQNQCKQQLDETNLEREQLASDINQAVLEQFERIFSTKKGTAVSKLENDICTGCHMKVTPTTAATVRRAKSLAHCDQCGRILYKST